MRRRRDEIVVSQRIPKSGDGNGAGYGGQLGWGVGGCPGYGYGNGVDGNDAGGGSSSIILMAAYIDTEAGV